eukprot:m.233584 g.233584  ORF g.233584 m.233584 type:complete len:88 (-) comp19218_c0_seq1:38-301(-)
MLSKSSILSPAMMIEQCVFCVSVSVSFGCFCCFDLCVFVTLRFVCVFLLCSLSPKNLLFIGVFVSALLLFVTIVVVISFFVSLLMRG